MHHLGDLPKGRYVCEAAEAQDVDECVGALQRAATRAEEDLAPFLPPEKRAYVFGGMAAAAARFVVWLLPELKVSDATHEVIITPRLVANFVLDVWIRA